MRAAVSSYCADDDSVMVLNLMKPLEACYTAELYPNRWLIAAILIGSTHFQLEIPLREEREG